MAVRRSTSFVVIHALTAGLTVTGLLLAMPSAHAAPAAPTSTTCAVAGAHRARDVHDANLNAHAAAVAGVSADDWKRLSQDPTLRVTACGDPYFADQHEVVQESVSPSTTPTDVNGTATPPYATANTFKLNSRPAAKHTLYLDFLGGTVTGTQWNSAIGQSTINVAPFSNDSTISRSWSTSDFGAIQHVWQVVAEDYAPFDVNVTTQCPGAMRSDGTCNADTTGAISRSSGADLVYGSIIRITPQQSNPAVWSSPNGCGTQCDGLSWLNVASTSGAGLTKQPSWMFPSIGDYTPNMIGSVASHEIGHQLGLSHDGDSAGSYYWGTAQWSPIMGGAFSIDNTWSKGEYPDANNHEDDLEIIRAKWGTNPTGIGHTPGTATQLLPGKVQHSVLTGGSDVYTIPAGAVSISASAANYAPNLDIRLTIRDKSWSAMADVNPAADTCTSGSPPARLCGMNASWSGSLPSSGAPYYLQFQSGGSAYYTAYGSLGNYDVKLTANGLLGATTQITPFAADTAFSFSRLTAAGGSGTGYHFSLILNSQTVAGISVAGNGLVSGNVPMNNIAPVADRTLQYRVVDDAGHSAVGTATLVINPGALYFRCLGTTTVQAGNCASHDINAGYGAAHVGHGYGPVIIKAGRGWSGISTSGTSGGDKFTFAGGTVPPGMTLGYLNGYVGKQYAVLSGTPSRAGTYTFKVTATDQHNHAVTTYLTMKVS